MKLYTARIDNFLTGYINGRHPVLLICQVLIVCLNSIALTSQASPVHPFSITNTSPIIIVHGLPTSRDPAVTGRDEVAFGLVYEITSHFTHHNTINERLYFDGETTRAVFSWKTGISDTSDIEIQLPYVSHDGGFLDSFIIDWHNLFGFPQNGRDQVANNQLEYLYEKDGVTRLEFLEPASGVGDMQLIYSFRINKRLWKKQNNLAFKTAIKIPSGDYRDLTGSGGYALSALFAGDTSIQLLGKPGANYFNLGAMWLEEGKILPDQQNSWVWFAGAGSGLRVSERIALQLQLDMHSPFYHSSDLIELDSYALQITVGGNLKLSEYWNLDIGVAEDLIVHASPDVIFHLQLNGRL